MKKMLLLLLCYNFAVAYSQDRPNMIPPSPKTQEFNKYLNYKVSLYNGLPEISIPLYTIEVRGVSIPVNLSYHASGIKMRQDNGDVGVGWTLNPGYRVSRTINGLADEYESMPSSFDSVSYYNFDLAKRDRYLARYLYNQPDRPQNSGSDKLDGEYDMFNFSLPTESGSFIISDRTNKTIALIDSSNVKIDYSTLPTTVPGISGITGVRITNDTGIKYYAGEYLSAANNWVYETNSMYGGNLGTAWAVTDVITPTGEQIHFKYVKVNAGGWMPHQKTFTFVERVNVNALDNELPSSYSWTDGVDGGYATFLVNEITSPNEKITFTRGTTNLVNSIDVRSAANVPIKKVQFYYSENTDHSFLDSLKVFDAANKAVECYKFEYYDKDANPRSMVHDQWGYYQSYGGNPYVHLYHEEFLDDIVNINNSSSSPHNMTGHISEVFNEASTRSFVPFPPIFFSLKKITYPTGGSTEYVYESNKSQSFSSNNKNGGGLRIRQINQYTEDDVLASNRDYIYGEDGDGYGIATLLISADLFVDESVRLRVASNGPYLYPQRVIHYSTNIQGDVDPKGYAGSYVVYPEVTEYYGSSNLNESNAGKILYRYNIGRQYLENRLSGSGISIPNSQYRNSSPLYIHYYLTWNNPMLKEKVTYALNNDHEYDRVRREAFSYQNKSILEYRGLKVRPFASAEEFTSSTQLYYNYIPSFFEYGEYTISCSRNFLSEKREVSYFNNDSLAVIISYNYNNLNLTTKESFIDSKGDIHQKKFLYPKDMVNLNRDPYGIYQAMVNHNIITPCIEETMLVNNIQNKLIRNNYINLNSSIFVLGTVQTQSKPTDVEETRLIYHDYDNSGNVLSVSRDGFAKTNYIWSYNRRYPIAEIKNADYLTIENILGGASAVSTFSSLTSPNKTDIDNFLLPLKNSLPNSQITIYTYQPLVGMTSQTDSKGMTTYYEYDSFQRLKAVKDQNGKVLKSYDYHYRP